MYDLSKMIYLEESSKGYTVRMTRADNQSVVINWLPFSDKEHKSLTKFNAETQASHLMNNMLDILEEVSGKDIPDQDVQTVKAEW